MLVFKDVVAWLRSAAPTGEAAFVGREGREVARFGLAHHIDAFKGIQGNLAPFVVAAPAQEGGVQQGASTRFERYYEGVGAGRGFAAFGAFLRLEVLLVGAGRDQPLLVFPYGVNLKCCTRLLAESATHRPPW